jgi:D-alanyl-D-alanine carboxypeptidase
MVYYVNPGDNIAYIINTYEDFYSVAKALGLPLTDAQLRLAAMNKIQDTYDPAYYGTAYVKYDGQSYTAGREAARLLPLASLTKVMTALVLADLNINWDKAVEISPAEIKYPCTLQACGSTSEIDLKVGDRVRVGDLFIAMLAASSNQSAVILADNSGLSREDFVKKMNNKAIELGLTKTEFVEMSGLSADNVSTAEEFAKIAKAAFSKELISSATRQTDYIFFVEQADGTPRAVEVLNRNYSLLAMGPDASKSGYLIEAQRNAVVQKAGQVAVALHCYSLTQRNDIIKRLLEGEEMAQAN